MRLGDRSHDGSIAACRSGDEADVQGGCSSHAAAMQQGQAAAALACLPSMAEEMQVEAGMKPPSRHPSAQDITHGLQGTSSLCSPRPQLALAQTMTPVLPLSRAR